MYRLPALSPETAVMALPLDSFLAEAELDGQRLIAAGTYLNDRRRYSAAVHVDHAGLLVGCALGIEQLA